MIIYSFLVGFYSRWVNVTKSGKANI